MQRHLIITAVMAAPLLCTQVAASQTLSPEKDIVELEESIALLEKGDINSAIARLEHLLRTSPLFESAYTNLAMIHLEHRDDPDSAISVLTAASKHFSHDPAIQVLLGHAHLANAGKQFARRQYDETRHSIASSRTYFSEIERTDLSPDLCASVQLGIGASYHLEADLLRSLDSPDSSAAAASAYDHYRRAFDLDPSLREQIRQLEIDLLLPAPRFPKTYSLEHLSVTLKERIKKMGSKRKPAR